MLISLFYDSDLQEMYINMMPLFFCFSLDKFVSNEYTLETTNNTSIAKICLRLYYEKSKKMGSCGKWVIMDQKSCYATEQSVVQFNFRIVLNVIQQSVNNQCFIELYRSTRLHGAPLVQD